jgi:hypothetical protein
LKPPQSTALGKPKEVEVDGRAYYLFPASKVGNIDATEHVRLWLSQGFWGMGESTPGRKHLRKGDHVCFYVVGVGIAVTAVIGGPATNLLASDEIPTGPSDHPLYKVPLQNVEWLITPVVIDADVRRRLEAFKDKDVNGMWAWLVQTNRKLTKHDFDMLAGKGEGQSTASA